MLDYDFESLAEGHIEAWQNRYFGKSRQDVIIDLECNYDWSCEIEYNNVPDADFEEFQHEFIKEVLKQLGMSLPDDLEYKLKQCIEQTEGDVKEKLTYIYNQLVY